MKVEVRNGNLVVIIPLESPRPSRSGKTLIVASTNGFVMTDAQHPKTKSLISVSLNATIRK